MNYVLFYLSYISLDQYHGGFVNEVRIEIADSKLLSGRGMVFSSKQRSSN